MNTYSDNTFFVGQFEIPNFYTEFDSPRDRKTNKVLQATQMAATLTDYNLPEHFGLDGKFLKEILIVQAYGQIKVDKDVNYLHRNKLFTVNNEALTKQRISDFTPVIILQGIVFDHFFTDAFLVSTTTEAINEMNHKGITTVRPAQFIYTQVIDKLKFN